MSNRALELKAALETELASVFTKIDVRLELKDYFLAPSIVIDTGLLLGNKQIVSFGELEAINPEILGRALGEKMRQEYRQSLKEILAKLDEVDEERNL